MKVVVAAFGGDLPQQPVQVSHPRIVATLGQRRRALALHVLRAHARDLQHRRGPHPDLGQCVDALLHPGREPKIVLR